MAITDFEMQIAGRLMAFRKGIGLTQKELAKEFSVTQGYISHMESGKLSIPADFIRFLYEKHELDIHWLFTGEKRRMYESEVREESPEYILSDIRERLKNVEETLKRK
jgi:transcriptional regulator with XRE-family HTH domain